MKYTVKPTLSITVMFAGILIGVVVLISTKNQHAPAGRHKPMDVTTAVHQLPPVVSMDKKRFYATWERFIDMMKVKSKLKGLMQKDTLSQQDSSYIKTIDKQLNQLIHD